MLKIGAFIVADIHFDDLRTDFFDFLEYVKLKKPPQLVLLGDVFNVLIGGIKSSIKDNEILIKQLDDLALEIEIIYFEGNHDFNLDKIFKNIKIIKKQPILLTLNDKNIAIAHGDIFLPFFTQCFLSFLRFKSVIAFLSFINFVLFNKIYENICKRQKLKKLYKKLKNFDEIVKKRIKSYEKFFSKQSLKIDLIIEGHFHQGFEYSYNEIKYYNLESFANERSFFILECENKIVKRKLPERSDDG